MQTRPYKSGNGEEKPSVTGEINSEPPAAEVPKHKEDMSMGTIELDSKVKELRELRRMAEELAAEMEAITDSIKAEMTRRNVEELAGTDWKASYKAVSSTRLDTAALKKALPEIAERFSKSSSTRRFVLA